MRVEPTNTGEIRPDGYNDVSRRRFLAQIGGGFLVLVMQPVLRRMARADPNSDPLGSTTAGRVTTTIFMRSSDSTAEHFRDFAVPLPEDLVVVGGGAVATEGPPGALLTASYPSADLSRWLVSAKDHEEQDQFAITGYAIGLKVDGMSARDLRKHIVLVKASSPVASRPAATATLPDGFALLGGGFNVRWRDEGNLATASYPSGPSSWTARAKDHVHPDPSAIDCYAIGIPRHLTVGRVRTIVTSIQGGEASHPTAKATLIDGYALTGAGAFVEYHGDGSLLWQIQPAVSPEVAVIAASKDHESSDPARVRAYAIGMRIDG